MMKPNKKIVASILFVLISFVCIAQASTDVSPPSPERGPVPVGLPIDTGVYILLAIGLLYGIIKILRFSTKV